MTLTEIAAAYGAILSTITFGVQIWQSRPKLKIGIEESVIFKADGQWTPTVVAVTPKNPGRKAINLVSLGFEFPNKKGIQVPRPLSLPVEFKFPHELQPENYCIMWIEAMGLALALQEQSFTGKVKVRAVLRDAVDRRYRSKWLEFDSDKYRTEGEKE